MSSKDNRIGEVEEMERSDSPQQGESFGQNTQRFLSDFTSQQSSYIEPQALGRQCDLRIDHKVSVEFKYWPHDTTSGETAKKTSNDYIPFHDLLGDILDFLKKALGRQCDLRIDHKVSVEFKYWPHDTTSGETAKKTSNDYIPFHDLLGDILDFLKKDGVKFKINKNKKVIINSSESKDPQWMNNLGSGKRLKKRKYSSDAEEEKKDKIARLKKDNKELTEENDILEKYNTIMTTNGSRSEVDENEDIATSTEELSDTEEIFKDRGEEVADLEEQNKKLREKNDILWNVDPEMTNGLDSNVSE